MQRHIRSMTTRPTAPQPPSRRFKPRSTRPHRATRSSSARATTSEGAGAPGTNALTITKSLTLKGAGADLVTITPKAAPLVGGRILEDEPDLRNGVGDIVAIVGTPTQPLTVNISGVTVDGYDPAGPRRRGRGGHPLPRRQGLGQPQPRDERRHLRGRQRLHAPGRLARRAAGHRHRPDLDRDARAGRRRAPPGDRPHARRQVQPRRHPDRRRAERLRAVHAPPAPSTGASSPPARSSAARCASTTPAPAPATRRACSPPARCSARTACASRPAPTPRSTAR